MTYSLSSADVSSRHLEESMHGQPSPAKASGAMPNMSSIDITARILMSVHACRREIT